LSLFALTWAFGSLGYIYTRFMQNDSSDDQSHQRQDENQRQNEGEHIPLNDDEKRKFKENCINLQTILENICNDLSNIKNNFGNNDIYEFNGK
jgi:hypothetical protein